MAEQRLNGQTRRWHLLPDDDAVLAEVAERVAAKAASALAARERFSIVLAGGTTPARLYRSLAELDTDWSRWWILFGDERCLPEGSADRNDTMAREAWLDRVPIPARQVLAIPAELGPEAGAYAYADTVAPFGRFDLVLLGVGEDGHTASLFPNSSVGWNGSDDHAPVATTGLAAVPVMHAPKPPPERVSLSAARLAQSDAVWFLATGQAKREALQRWHRGEVLPVAAVAPAAGVDIFTDCDPAADVAPEAAR